MNVRLVEAWKVLNLLCERCVVWLRNDLFHKRWVCECVHDPRNEVASQTVWGRIVDGKLSLSEWTILNTATASAASDV